MPEQEGAFREQLAAHLTAVGLGAEVQRLDELVAGYRSLLAGVDRIAALDLGELEPAYVLALAETRLPAADQRP